MKQYDIAVIGGDRRIAYVSDLLEKKGYKIISYGVDYEEKGIKGQQCHYATSLLQAMELADIVVGGIPFCKGEFVFSQKDLKDLTKENFTTGIRKGHTIFGGMLTEDVLDTCIKRDAVCFDFMKEETIVLKNTIATAEGAILVAMQNQPTNLHKSECLVLGYGRCGKVLAEKLKGLSAKVTVCSKCQEELALGESFGMNICSLESLEKEIDKYEYIFNTIPAVVVKRNLLSKIRNAAIVIDIASEPGGVDYLAAEELGVHTFHCLGLPGKYAALTSAVFLAEYIVLQMGVILKRKSFQHPD